MRQKEARFLFLLILSCASISTCLELNRKRGGGIRLGKKKSADRSHSSPTTTSYTTDPSMIGARSKKIDVRVAVVLPHSMFKMREYKKRILTATSSTSLEHFKLKPYLDMLPPIPAPTEVLDKICDHFLPNRTVVVIYMTESSGHGRQTMASQYFLQLAQYVRLPVLAWNADNAAFDMAAAQLRLQLAPTIKHQAEAVLSLLRRYGWHSFVIVTGTIAGHGNFDQVHLCSDSEHLCAACRAFVSAGVEASLTRVISCRVKI